MVTTMISRTIASAIRSFALLAFAMVAAAPRFASSQSQASPVSGTTIRLTLGELYDSARARSPRIKGASALAAATRARIASARRPPDPEVQLGFMNRSLPSLTPMDALGMMQLQLMQMVPTPGKLRLAGHVAYETAAAAEARAIEAAWEVKAQAAMTFYDLYAIDRQLAIVTDTRRLVQDIAKVAQAMYSVGDGRQADVLRAQVEVAKMTEETTRMQAMREGMAARLLGIVDLPAATKLGTPQLLVIPDDLPQLAELTGQAEKDRPMIAAGQREVAAAVASERLARKEIWPDLQVGVQYAWQRGAMGTERMGSLMLGATVPIHARSRQLKMRDEAAAMRVMAEADLASMRAATRARMTELYAEFTRASNLETLYSTTILPQAEGAVTSSFSAYRVGSVNLMTVLDNQMILNTYRQELVALEAARGKAVAEIEMLLGRELFPPAANRRATR
jgi:cobalt-zinc-cadmium efflux system outer membrane protein